MVLDCISVPLLAYITLGGSINLNYACTCTNKLKFCDRTFYTSLRMFLNPVLYWCCSIGTKRADTQETVRVARHIEGKRTDKRQGKNAGHGVKLGRARCRGYFHDTRGGDSWTSIDGPGKGGNKVGKESLGLCRWIVGWIGAKERGVWERYLVAFNVGQVFGGGALLLWIYCATRVEERCGIMLRKGKSF